MADIFLSYNESDRETVRRLADAFRRVGWSVWWDRRIPAGGTWRTLLEQELESMRCMVVVWSTHSVKSEWVHEEATEGRLRGCLVPVCIEPVRPPAGFREIQAADLVGWDGTTTFVGMRTLIEDIEQRLGRPPVGAPHEAIGQPPGPLVLPQTQTTTQTTTHGDAGDVAPRRWSRRWIAVYAAVGVVAIALGSQYVVRRPVSPEIGAGVGDARGPPPDAAAEAPRERPPETAAASPSIEAPQSAPAAVAARPAGPGPVVDKKASAVRGRCSDLLQRQSLGETLAGDSIAFLRKECRS